MNFTREIPVARQYDVVVCGGGPSGIPAAIAARREGLSVLIVEATGQLGGAGTAAGVSHLLGGMTYDQRKPLVAGIYAEVVSELSARGGAIDPKNIDSSEKYTPFGLLKGLSTGVPFDPPAMVAYLDDKMLREGVDVLFNTSFVDAVVKDNRITEVVLFNKSGLFAVGAKAVVDATGDADVAARSGCETVKGREGDGLMTPTTLIFHVDGVDQQQLMDYVYEHDAPRFREEIQRLREAGEWPFPYEIFIPVQLTQEGTMMINTTRICDVDGTDGFSISEGMMQGRKEVYALFELMRKHFPGFADARVKFVAPSLGVRETRRIVGDFVYREADMFGGVDYPDNITFSGHPYDLPDPKKPSQQDHHHTARKRNWTAVPFRCMVPRPVENVICPGRAVSVERFVLGPVREQAPCYGMGHAAGVAAGMVVKNGIAFKEVDTDTLRARLADQGAIVDFYG